MNYRGLFPNVPDLIGCSDGGCYFRPPTGQHTNGGCGCMKPGADFKRLQLNMSRISDYIKLLEKLYNEKEPSDNYDARAHQARYP